MADMHKDLIVSAAPHIVSPADTATIMRDVVIALIPALAVSTYVFGFQAILLTAVCVIACVFFEWAARKILKRENTIGDWSAIVTGVILAFNLPVSISLCVVFTFVVQFFSGT